MRILAFGDSITYGAWDSQGGWVERLKQYAHTKTIESNGLTKIQVLNLGVGGDTSSKLLKRIEPEIIARQSNNWPLTIVLTFGANDERSIHGVSEVNIDTFKQNVEEILTIAQRYSTDVYVIESPPLNSDTILFKNQEYSNKRIQEYMHAQQAIAAKLGITYLPIYQKYIQSATNLLSSDNLHPNDAGHDVIYQTVKDVLFNNSKT